MPLKCGSCGTSLVGQENFVKMKCPNCNDAIITRCRQCKNLSVPYKCPKCKFEGP